MNPSKSFFLFFFLFLAFCVERESFDSLLRPHQTQFKATSAIPSFYEQIVWNSQILNCKKERFLQLFYKYIYKSVFSLYIYKQKKNKNEEGKFPGREKQIPSSSLSPPTPYPPEKHVSNLLFIADQILNSLWKNEVFPFLCFKEVSTCWLIKWNQR